MVETLSNVTVVDGRDEAVSDIYLFDKHGVQVTPKIVISAEYQKMSRREARAIMLSQAAKSDRRIQKEVIEQVADREAKAAVSELLGETLGNGAPFTDRTRHLEEVHEEDEDEDVDMEGYS